MKDYLKKYFAVLGKKARKQLPFLMLLFLGSSFLDMIGIGMVGAFVSLIATPALILNKLPLSLLAMVNQVPRSTFLYVVGVSIIVIFTIKGCIAYLVQKKIANFSFHTQANLQSQLMRVYQFLPYHLRINRNSTALINILQNVVPNYTGGVLMASLQLVSNTFIFFAICSVLLVTNPWSLLFVVAFLAVMMLFYDKFFREKLKRNGATALQASIQISKGISEGMQGFKEIRVLGCEAHFHQMVNNNILKFANANSLATALQYVPRYLIESIMVAFVICTFLSAMLASQDPMTLLPVFSIFMAAAVRLIPSFTQIVTNINQLRFSSSALNKVFDELTEVQTIEGVVANAISTQTDKNSGYKGFSEIKLENIDYSYPGTKNNILKEISLTIKAGESVAFIGSSGAGKTTIIDIILGLLEPVQGMVAVNGKPILQNMRDWLNQIAYIPQNIFIIDDNLQRNIALGVSDAAVDFDRLTQAVHLAQLDDVVAQLDQGLQTVLGENGVRLSGGQRQRVALARAFYHERDLIVMDEATSALDSETEHEVVNSIKLLKGKKTIIVIAHRLSTVQHCDTLYRIDGGKIIAQGTYDEVCGVVEN